MAERTEAENLSPPDVKQSWFGQAITFVIFSLGRLMALLRLTILMGFVVLLAGYLVLPSEAFYSLCSSSPGISFVKPNLRETLAAACATFFVITLFLWVFDAIEFFPFRNPWMSKAVWGTGIASIMSTSVLVYSQVVGPQQQELDGIWQARMEYRTYQQNSTQFHRKDHLVVMTYDADSGTYIGQSDFNFDYWFSLRVNLKENSVSLTSAQPIYTPGEDRAVTNRTIRTGTERQKVFLQNNKTRILIGEESSNPILTLQRHGPFE